MPEPLEAGDELGVIDGHLAVEDERIGIELTDSGHDAWEPTRVVEAVPAHQLDGPGDLVGEHPPAVYFLFIDPALPVEGPGDLGWANSTVGRGTLLVYRMGQAGSGAALPPARPRW